MDDQQKCPVCGNSPCTCPPKTEGDAPTTGAGEETTTQASPETPATDTPAA